MQASPHQQAILDSLSTGTRNSQIQATAGSGKTTTLRLICELLLTQKPKPSICALAFNKSSAEAFAAKLPAGVTSSTVHSLGFGIIRANVANVKFDPAKQDRLFRSVFGREATPLSKLVRKTVPLCMHTMTDPTNIAAFRSMCDQYDIDLDGVGDDLPHDALEVAKHTSLLLGLGREETRAISFDDMIDHVVTFKLKGSAHYDYVLGDEVQDWNKQQATFVHQLASGSRASVSTFVSADLMALLGDHAPAPIPQRRDRPTVSRVITVGDCRQAIYRFRGADDNAMVNLKAMFDSDELPLSVCYRCPTSVIEIAQGVVGVENIQAAPGAPVGQVIRRRAGDLSDTLAGLVRGDMVMCRTNAPLVPGALACIARGVKATVRGRDIGVGVTGFVADTLRRTKPTSLKDYVQKLGDWVGIRIAALVSADKIKPAQLLEDQYGCVVAVAERCTEVYEIAQQLDGIFADDGDGVVFSSVHKAKGLEAETAVILAPELMPHPMAAKARNFEAAMTQERNLYYVAVTRAMSTLIYQPMGRGRSDFPALNAVYDRAQREHPTTAFSETLNA